MTLEELLGRLSETDILALTMWAEARGDWREGHSSVEERIAVGCVVRNRLAIEVHAHRRTYRAICLAPNQFSCWNPGTDPNHPDQNHLALIAVARALHNGQPMTALFAETRFLARGIVEGVILDRTAGATMYYAPLAMVPPGRKPFWAIELERQGKVFRPIGDQLFA